MKLRNGNRVRARSASAEPPAGGRSPSAPPRRRGSAPAAALAVAVLALGLAGGAWALAPAAGAATDLIANPGLETGSLSPWSCDADTGSVVGSPVHSGSYALAGAPTSADDAQCTQTVAVQPDTEYTLSAYVEGDYVYLGATGYTDAWTPAAAGWTQLSTTFTTGASTTSVPVYIHGWYAEGAYWADDFSLTAVGGSGTSPSASVGTTPPASPTATASPSGSTSPSASPTSTGTPGGSVVQVSTASQLSSALNKVVPGETIELAAGTYSGEFTATISGTAAAPITLTGPSTAVLSGYNIDSGYGVHLEASYWTLSGFSVTTAQKGVVLDGADYDVINGLHVNDIGDEGIHLRSFSSDDLVENNTVTNTGQYEPGYGEGVYIGSAESNWVTYSGGQPDTSNDDVIKDNTLGPGITAENIDVKEGTTGGTIEGNSFNATGEADANSAVAWVDVKGNDYTVTGNTGVDAYEQGFLVEQLYAGFGCGNTFADNDLDLGSAPGYGFDVIDQSDCATDPNIVYASNTVTGGAGASTIPITPGG
jgi:Carbohydrate binding domain/Right handed beta helix region